MVLRLLGAAAGGGYPQWNCACESCRRVRSRPSSSRCRFHTSLAVSVSGKNWTLLNATPDVHLQIESYTPLQPGPGIRESPVREVLLTDAELDHTIGLLILRGCTALEVCGTATVLECLTRVFPLARLIERYAGVHWREIRTNETFLLDGGKLQVRAFRIGRKPPRYARESSAGTEWVVAYRLEGVESKGVAVFAPAIEAWGPELEAELVGADCAFLDGTFWSDDEMILLRAGQLTAREMGHLPIGGAGGSAENLSALRIKRKVYVHVNNTNPILNEQSPERLLLAGAGIEVGWDGLEVRV